MTASLPIVAITVTMTTKACNLTIIKQIHFSTLDLCVCSYNPRI